MAIDAQALVEQLAKLVLFKGPTVRVFANWAANGVSSVFVDCRGFNAASINVLVLGGTTPSVDVKVLGARADQDYGATLLPDANATQTGITANKRFDVNVGSDFLAIQLANISGTTPLFSVDVTPYKAAGQTNIAITATASQNVSQWGGGSTSLGQKAMASSVPVVVASDQSAVAGSNAAASQADGHSATLGATADAEAAAGNGSLVALLKRLRTLLNGGLPAALAASGALKADVTSIAGTAPTTAGKLDVKSADGDQATLGATADAAVVAGAVGTISAKLRAISRDLVGNLIAVGNVASGAADSGNPVKVGGRYNLSAPTLTDGQRGDLQLDAAGRLITSLGTALSGEDFTNGRFLVETKPVDGDSVLETLQSAQTLNANGTAIDTKGYRSIVVDVTVSGFTGTVNFEGTIDDTNWFAVGLAAIATGTLATTATAAGTFYLPQGITLSQLRARTSSVTAGNVTVKSRKHPR